MEPVHHHAVRALKARYLTRACIEREAFWNVRVGPQVLAATTLGGLRRLGTVHALIVLISWEVDLVREEVVSIREMLSRDAMESLTTVKSLPFTAVFSSEVGTGSHEHQEAYRIDVRERQVT